ncbi:hypothetical protein LY76DRAFT_416847 [Colletotrichum caudatum]|nr:hypothetical protein LY76DRAFT_416847 [Colletotrichum caudatum]
MLHYLALKSESTATILRFTLNTAATASQPQMPFQPFQMKTASIDQSNSDNGTTTTEWQVKQIQGHSDVRGAIYYHVVWEPTWESEDRLQHMLRDIVAWNKRYGYSDHGRKPLPQFDRTLKDWSGKIIGRKIVNSIVHYKIEWQETMEPEANLDNATSLLKDYWDTLYSIRPVIGDNEDEGERI